MTAISVEHVSKHFGARHALNDVSLTIAPGEMVALIGASGSGKSTLIRHIAGLDQGDTGSGVTTIFGNVIQKNGRLAADARLLRRDIGVIFQQFNLVGRLPVIVNVLVGLLGRIPVWRGTLGLFTRAEKSAARAALSRVGVGEVAWQRASTLSGGQQQRAAIARALVQRARLLLADEPIASLDPASARRVMDTLATICREDGITVLISLHQVEYARFYCPRTIAMRAGQVVYDGPSTALTTDFLTELYGEASDELVLPEAPLAETTPVRSAASEPLGIPAPATAAATA
ncbi:phosphonate ABC transporter ATP-binding protein [Acuticoccus mangrovi]|uniref:Phosphonate ABC transporter ATP-binding protein n=1 Tax=Acuticoccus mangrovi TaxID=2796142 RepID=A0A934MIW3_9HYPH|nr:phosphonate ABC transporter ATP-binding protein [Acuticoccus mangrovi]MBJ3777626.1 phosphonate ABC transporter ATP-binding protein [Acuticoccus mangrovi]